METIVKVEVGDTTYNAVRASAVNQKRLMSLISARISLNSAASGAEEIEATMILGLLISLPEKDFDEVASIVLHKTVEGGGDKLITVDDFQDDIHLYFYLVAELILANLKTFFTWLDGENAKQRLVNEAEAKNR